VKEGLAFNIGDQFWLKTNEGIKNTYSEITDFSKLFSSLLFNIYVLAGVILLFLLIGGGLTIIISAGQNNPENASKGQKAITAAIIGFLVIFASYWIIKIVETITGLKII